MLDITTTVVYIQQFAQGLPCSDKRFRSNPALCKQFVKTLLKIKAVERFQDLNLLGGLHLEALSGQDAGTWSVRINQQYRLLFTVEPPGADPVEVTGLVLLEISNHYA